jgi:hypothetical protein
MDGNGALKRGIDYRNRGEYAKAKVAFSVVVELFRRENNDAYESQATLMLATEQTR